MTTDGTDERLAAARRRDQLCDRFERGALPRPTIEALLSEVPEAERIELLRELIALEVWRRRKDGEVLTARDYLNRFPGLDPTWLHHLLPAEAETASRPGTTVTPGLAQSFGDYELLGELGRGGMGVVYKARERRLKRLVALKVLRDAAADADERARLRAEAESAARLQHANIVQVFEVGEHGGAPFLAMELCDGGSLAARLAATPLPAAEAAALARTLAEAVQHAHERGVVHRDLKPANVLMADNGIPKVADFGLARRLDAETLRTQSGDVLGTPSYMAPEQALGRSREAGAAADVYSLGAILYECLTGRPPFKAASTLETLRQVVSVEPVPPRQLQPEVPRDLNTVCLHCLHKEPARRYATAQALADDLGRFLRGEPVHARPVGPLERLVKWTRRNPLAALLVLTLSAGVLAASALAWRAEVNAAQARSNEARADANAARASEQEGIAVGKTADAERELGRSQKMLYLRTVAAAQQAWRDTQFDRANALLAESPAELCGWEHRYLRRLVASRGEPFPVEGVSHYRAVVFAPDSTWIAGTGHGAVNVWDAATRRRSHVLIAKAARPYWSLAVRPDGKWLAAGGSDGTVNIWDVTTGKEVGTLQALDAVVAVRSLAFTPDGKTLACGGLSMHGQPGLSIWDVDGRKVLQTPKVPPRHRIFGLALSPDGRTLATAGDLGIHLWDVGTGQFQRVLGGAALPRANCLVFPPSGRWVVAGYHDFVAVWDLRTAQFAEIARGVSEHPNYLAVRPDGRRLAAGVGNRVLVWDFLNGAEPSVLRGHTGAITGLDFARDGRIATASMDETVRLWNPDAAQDEQHLRMPSPGAITGLTFLDGGRRLGTVNNSKSQLIWELETGRVLEGRVHFDRLGALLPADRDGTRLFTWSADRKLWTWDATGPRPQMLDKGVALDLPERVAAVTVSRDGRLLAALDGESRVGVWDTATGRRLHLLPAEGRRLQDGVRTLAFAPDGRALLIVRKERAVQAWDVETGHLRATRPNNAAAIQALACSPDARHHAVGCADGHVHLWDFDSDRSLFSFKAHDGAVAEIVYTPDGRRIVTGGQDGAVRVWDVESGQEALTLRQAGIPVARLTISPDGSQIAAGDGQGNIAIWKAGPEPLR